MALNSKNFLVGIYVIYTIFIPYNNIDPHIRDQSIPSFGTFVGVERVEKRCERARELVAVMAMIAVRASRNEVSPERY